jgi:hypothetical protein
MQNVTVSKEAIALISAKCQEPGIASRRTELSVPLLSWASRVMLDDLAGNRTELGPQFYFTWSTPQQIREYGYLTLTLDNGDELALAPGDFFRSGNHRIDQKDDRLTLDFSA